jgi:tRNA(Ile)-lysidine synthase
MNLVSRFQEYIRRENLFSPGSILLLAVSGGIDSVVLCELCRQAGYDFVLTHCNFQLRGPESERDEDFVRQLAAKYNKPILVKHFDTTAYAKEHKVSIQVAARELRYNWFFSMLDQKPSGDITAQDSPLTTHHSPLTTHDSPLPTHDSRLPTHVLTAHHRDDNIETMLMNFFKGTGIAGLRGMLPRQGRIVRPLLFAAKEDLLQYAADQGLQWVEDSSNELDKYARNYLRHQMIPLVKNIYPEAEKNMAGNLERFRDIETLYRLQVAAQKKKLLEIKGNEIHIPVLKLQQATAVKTVVYEIVKDYGFSPQQAEEVMSLLHSETGRYVQSPSHRVIKNRQWLIITPLQANAAAHILIEAAGKELAFEAGLLQWQLLKGPGLVPAASSHIALLDAAALAFPLLVRKWKTGDYFYPLGMKKKKKLARFFIDQKLSKTEKEKIWVIESNKKIVWVAGYRIDDRCKITPHTKQAFQFTLKALDIGAHLPDKRIQ